MLLSSLSANHAFPLSSKRTFDAQLGRAHLQPAQLLQHLERSRCAPCACQRGGARKQHGHAGVTRQGVLGLAAGCGRLPQIIHERGQGPREFRVSQLLAPAQSVKQALRLRWHKVRRACVGD